MKKVFFLVLELLFFLFLVKEEVFAETAIECDLISAKVQDVSGQPIGNASVTVFINGEPDSLHPVTTREDGSFVYPWPVRGIIYVSITKNGYNSTNFNLTKCTGDIITMQSSTTPTSTPGTRPRCSTTCATNDQCSLATDGCTLCYHGTCINPSNRPFAVPTSSATMDSQKKLCNDDPKCMDCFMRNGIWSAVGCIPSGDLNGFFAWFLEKLVFVASGIAFLLMAFGAFQVLTSAGSPEKVQAGKELITSALAGLVFIILSLFLLKLIGVDILQIPGFGK
ncbi:MAG: hypothetical protein ACPLY7_02250 [Microgenomates group bacterium]